MQTFTKTKRTYLEHTGSKLSHYEDQSANKTLQKIKMVSLDELYFGLIELEEIFQKMLSIKNEK